MKNDPLVHPGVIMARRFKDYDWATTTADGKHYAETNMAQLLSVLMDVRDELKRLNNVLQCPNFIAVPSKLDLIRQELKVVRRNTTKRKRVAKPRLRVVA